MAGVLPWATCKPYIRRDATRILAFREAIAVTGPRMQQSTNNPSVGDAAAIVELQAVTIITEVAAGCDMPANTQAESRPPQPANSATPAATCMSRKREVLLFDASLFLSLTAQLSAMKKYFKEPLSTSRRGERLAESTVATTERRILSTRMQR